MWEYLRRLLDSSTLSPHGICLLWRPELIWLHVVSDGLIAAAYFSIPVALSVFVSKRRDVAFGWVFWAFAIFILACGTTHLFSIWTLWNPDYALEGLVKAVTAAASVFTAVMLWPLLPKLLALPSPEQLRAANGALLEEIKNRDGALIALQNEREERLKAEEMLRQSQKMEAIGQLTGGISHDFNNILTVIMGNLGFLVAAVSSNARLKTCAELIGRAADRGAELTRSLLAFARKQALQPRELDLNSLVSDTEQLLRGSLGADIDLVLMLDETIDAALVDAAQLQTSLLNLALNARDAMPNGGKLTVETSNKYLDEAYAAANSDVTVGAYVMLAVTDTGAGIPRDIQDRLFEPFFTTKDVGKGSGLGLSMVYGFIKQSGGHIKIYSEVGIGTTVKMYLPRASGVGGKIDNTADIDLLVTGHEVVLVVEDDELVRESLLTQLESLGYTTHAARNAEEALKILEAHADIALLFTDVVLPGGLNGRQLAVEACRRDPNLKVLYTSGYSQNAIVHHGRLDPGVLLLAKPYRKSELARALRTALRNERSGDQGN
jgi:signal transduction histidine kinase/ActR/RegA family two-component response regulator